MIVTIRQTQNGKSKILNSVHHAESLILSYYLGYKAAAFLFAHHGFHIVVWISHRGLDWVWDWRGILEYLIMPVG